ncbi:MAG: hypothetical protein Q4A74_01330 [Cardiobacteriaceae bacterium]|nr:hypothetical protein [Cardiobacteriaceae bacterium]
MFYLKKHYYDGSDKQGNTLIVYDARLRLLGIPLSYSACLLHYADGQKQHFSTLRRLKHHATQFTQPALALHGEWLPVKDSLPPLRIFSQGKKYIDWHCHTPQTTFSAQIAEQRWQGTGYAETLEMTLPPWYLPMHELRWGTLSLVNAYSDLDCLA